MLANDAVIPRIHKLSTSFFFVFVFKVLLHIHTVMVQHADSKQEGYVQVWPSALAIHRNVIEILYYSGHQSVTEPREQNVPQTWIHVSIANTTGAGFAAFGS